MNNPFSNNFGLLQNPLLMMGLSLLGRDRRAPIGQSMMQGLALVQQNQQQQRQNEMQDMRMELLRRQIAQEDARLERDAETRRIIQENVIGKKGQHLLPEGMEGPQLPGTGLLGGQNMQEIAPYLAQAFPQKFAETAFQQAFVPEKTESTTNMKEFEFAKKTGAFSGNFMQYMAAKREGLSLSVGPNGEIRFSQGGDTSAFPGFSPQTTPTENSTQADIITGTENLNNMMSIGANYSSEYLTYGGKLRAKRIEELDRLGKPVSEEDRNFLAGKTVFSTRLGQFFNIYRKEITGASAAIEELKALKEDIINKDMSPIQFEAAYADLINQMVAQIKFKQMLQRKGVPEQDIYKRIDSGEWITMMPGDMTPPWLLPENKGQ